MQSQLQEIAVNQITLGNYLVTKLRCTVTAITALSDARIRKTLRI